MCTYRVKLFVLSLILTSGTALEFIDGTYRGLTIAIESSVPKDNCQAILNNLEPIFLLAAYTKMDENLINLFRYRQINDIKLTIENINYNIYDKSN
ncbi:hypothetical protein O3M35_007521 [Rhynocoris fuscipes]|uniref:Uncharacterized protein n=1 Tax=Rhynocoris fuscipes TaxID=488301 RepID=A0AAW1D9X1_9HEMI